MDLEDAFESSVVPEDWSTECRNYGSISLLSMVTKIYAGILIDRVRRVMMSKGIAEQVEGL